MTPQDMDEAAWAKLRRFNGTRRGNPALLFQDSILTPEAVSSLLVRGDLHKLAQNLIAAIVLLEPKATTREATDVAHELIRRVVQ